MSPARDEWNKPAEFPPDFLTPKPPPQKPAGREPEAPPRKRAAKPSSSAGDEPSAPKRTTPKKATGAQRESGGRAVRPPLDEIVGPPRRATSKKTSKKATTGSGGGARKPVASEKTAGPRTGSQRRATSPPPEDAVERSLGTTTTQRRQPPRRQPERVSLFRPDRFPSLWRWATAGLRRQPLGSLAGLLVGWSGLVLALSAFALFLVVGLMEAAMQAMGGHSITLVHDFRLNVEIGVVSIFAALISPILQPLLFVIGLAVAEVVVLGGALTEPGRLSLRGYRRLSRREREVVEPLLHHAAERMGLARLPQLRVAPDPLPGAWAHIRTIVLSEALGLRPDFRVFDDAELEAILAHELQHWAEGDTAARLFAWACALPSAIPYWLAFGVMRRPPNTRSLPYGLSILGGLIGFVAALVFWPTWVLVHLFLAPLIARNAREQEYSADAAAAAALGGRGISTVLDHLRRVSQTLQERHEQVPVLEPPRTVFERALHASHPPIEFRLDAIADPDPYDAVPESDEAPRIAGRVLLGVVLVTAGLSIIANIHKPVKHHGNTSGSAGVATGPVSFTPYPGSSRSKDGVPQGYAHTQTGALAAATNDQLAFIRLPTMTTAQADRFVAAMSAPADVGSLQRTADQAITTLQQLLRSRQITRESETAQPLGYRFLSFDGDHAVIRIWLHTDVSMTNAGGTASNSSLSFGDWTMTWVGGDWRLSAVGASNDLPNPDLPSEATPYNPPAPSASFG